MTNDNFNVKVLSLLNQVECNMKTCGLWGDITPEPSAFMSNQPFFIDTMSFEQWLQYVLLPRFREMIELEQTLPKGMQLSPMAEECWRDHPSQQNITALCQTLMQLDKLFSI